MKIGFIGAGNMGGAILKGALKSGFLKPDEVTVFDLNQKIVDDLANEYGITSAENNCALVQASEWILLAVKPVFLGTVLKEIAPYLHGKKIISIAAGWSMKMLMGAVEAPDAGIMRVMPNTPALIGAGLTALCEETTLNQEDREWVRKLFENLGVVEVVPERLFDAVVAVSGSSPAYVFMFIEAMADAAVKLGMPRKMAISSAAQAVMGSAKMILETREHPAVLKDNVCSPGGTTIEAVEALEAGGMRAAVINAMTVCAEKNRKMSS